MIIALAVLSLIFSFTATLLPLPVAMGFSIYALMFWALSWVIHWGSIRYARIRRQHH